MSQYLVFPRSNFIGMSIRLFHSTVFHGTELGATTLVHSLDVLPPVIQPGRHLLIRESVLSNLAIPASVSIERFVEEIGVRISYLDEDKWGAKGWNDPDIVLRELAEADHIEPLDDRYLRLLPPRLTDLSKGRGDPKVPVDVGCPPFVEIEMLPTSSALSMEYPLIAIPGGHILDKNICGRLISLIDDQFFVVRQLQSQETG